MQFHLQDTAETKHWQPRCPKENKNIVFAYILLDEINASLYDNL